MALRGLTTPQMLVSGSKSGNSFQELPWLWFLIIVNQNRRNEMQEVLSYQEFSSPRLTVDIIELPL